MRALKYIVVGLLATLVLGPIGLGLVILAAILRRGKS